MILDSTIIAEDIIKNSEELNDTDNVINQEEKVEEVSAEKIILDPLLKGIIRVYQDDIPWSNRTNATLLSLGKILGVDYFIQPLSDLSLGIPCDTTVVLISSNSNGNLNSAIEERLPMAQQNLECFVRGGGVLIVDLARNGINAGYLTPGSEGIPDLVFPDIAEAYKLFLTKKSYCTTFVNGPTLTLTPNNISMDPTTRYSAHGNLVDGITIPKRAEILMSAIFNGIKKPVLAYYYLGDGFVILDTITKEFYGQAPTGYGATNIITNLIFFAYHLSRLCFL